MAGVDRNTTVGRHVVAGCFQCWGSEPHWETANAQALAARHHDSTGHQTWADVSMFVTYGEDTPVQVETLWDDLSGAN